MIDPNFLHVYNIQIPDQSRQSHIYIYIFLRKKKMFHIQQMVNDTQPLLSIVNMNNHSTNLWNIQLYSYEWSVLLRYRYAWRYTKPRTIPYADCIQDPTTYITKYPKMHLFNDMCSILTHYSLLNRPGGVGVGGLNFKCKKLSLNLFLCLSFLRAKKSTRHCLLNENEVN